MVNRGVLTIARGGRADGTPIASTAASRTSDWMACGKGGHTEAGAGELGYRRRSAGELRASWRGRDADGTRGPDMAETFSDLRRRC